MFFFRARGEKNEIAMNCCEGICIHGLITRAKFPVDWLKKFGSVMCHIFRLADWL